MTVRSHQVLADAELTPGVAVAIARGVRRLLAPNASPLTGPGTNTYLLGEPPVVVLDPGPASAAHVEAVVRAMHRIDTIFVTHTHPDHSPAAKPLAARTGARLVGRAPPRDGRQDESFVPEHEPLRDERFEVAGMRMRVIDTPGHASNHEIIDGVIVHRERREAKVLGSLAALRRATLDELLPRVYDDVRSELHGLARASLEAHLIKLQREGRCGRQDAWWLAL